MPESHKPAAALLALLPSYLSDLVIKDELTYTEVAEALGYNDACHNRPYNNPWTWRSCFGGSYRVGYDLAGG